MSKYLRDGFFTMGIMAQSGCGKSTFIREAIMRDPIWNLRCVFTSVGSEGGWVEELKDFPYKHGVTTMSADIVKLVTSLGTKKKTNGLTTKTMPRTLVIFDDFANEISKLTKGEKEYFIKIFTEGRKLGLSTIVVGHNFAALPVLARSQFKFLGIMKGLSYSEMAKFMNEIGMRALIDSIGRQLNMAERYSIIMLEMLTKAISVGRVQLEEKYALILPSKLPDPVIIGPPDPVSQPNSNMKDISQSIHADQRQINTHSTVDNRNINVNIHQQELKVQHTNTMQRFKYQRIEAVERRKTQTMDEMITAHHYLAIRFDGGMVSRDEISACIAHITLLARFLDVRLNVRPTRENWLNVAAIILANWDVTILHLPKTIDMVREYTRLANERKKCLHKSIICAEGIRGNHINAVGALADKYIDGASDTLLMLSSMSESARSVVGWLT